MSYDMIDRFLRNNLGDDDYAEYSAALDSLCTPQPKEKQPVAWMDANDPNRGTAFKWKNIGYHNTPLYTAPPKRKPLTDEELDLILQRSPIQANYGDLVALSRDIEAAHGIKE